MCDDPGDIVFGNRRYDGFQVGKTVIYWCYDAYELVGSPRITCKNNGRWSASKPKCERMYDIICYHYFFLVTY